MYSSIMTNQPTSGLERQMGPFSGPYLDIGPERDQVPKSGLQRKHCLVLPLSPCIFFTITTFVDMAINIFSNRETNTALKQFHRISVLPSFLSAKILWRILLAFRRREKKTDYYIKVKILISLLNKRLFRSSSVPSKKQLCTLRCFLFLPTVFLLYVFLRSVFLYLLSSCDFCHSLSPYLQVVAASSCLSSSLFFPQLLSIFVNFERSSGCRSSISLLHRICERDQRQRPKKKRNFSNNFFCICLGIIFMAFLYWGQPLRWQCNTTELSWKQSKAFVKVLKNISLRSQRYFSKISSEFSKTVCLPAAGLALSDCSSAVLKRSTRLTSERRRRQRSSFASAGKSFAVLQCRNVRHNSFWSIQKASQLYKIMRCKHVQNCRPVKNSADPVSATPLQSSAEQQQCWSSLHCNVSNGLSCCSHTRIMQDFVCQHIWKRPRK